MPELTIVIPAKNEATLLPKLLTSLTKQTYLQNRKTKVFVADAGSSDDTPQLAMTFRGRLELEVIPGGLPSVGRNAGARLADGEYVLFIDADMEFHDATLIARAVEMMRERQLHCLTTNIWCESGTALDQALYLGNNISQWLSQFASPYATGMFMLFDRKRFWELGGFHEQALFAEDYLLSKKVSPGRFAIIHGGAYTTNRRFRKMGHLKMVSLFLWTALNTWNEKHFLRDQKYWEV
ncbi:MAG: glycosyltransferase [Acidobacteriia bacterium]|nr:glycosyltransferase [Terriglobia bacterium]